jgi:hypothetical protein
MKIAAWQELKGKYVEDIRSMQQELITQSVNKHWECVQKGIEQYLSHELRTCNALLVRIDTVGEVSYIYYDNVLIGDVRGFFNEDQFISNCIKYSWEFTFYQLA